MILQRQSGLGKGLGALIPPKLPNQPINTNFVHAPELQTTAPVLQDGMQIVQIPVEHIERNPHQPRVHFDHQQLEELISSIKTYGIIQPLVVSTLSNGRYQLIAGERRLRASTIAGLATVPALVRDATEQQKLELALIENIQRQDLNAIEEAHAFERLLGEFNLTQDDLAKRVGKSRPQIANTLRLLNLPEPIQQALMERKISSSNGRTLLSLPTEEEQIQLFQALLAGNFTVRETERRVARQRRPTIIDVHIGEFESQLRDSLHCRVDIKQKPDGSGNISLNFTSEEELRGIIDHIRKGRAS